ncbi:MAG: gamma-glutamylcyclotransferase [Gammaproteobacteria bacterium]|nr:gamma-glutamylcyclotransferase [Gammaproteobacteria bacterium]
MYHFGYGSNLSIDFVKKELIPDASFVMKAYLPNFEVRFPFWSEEVQAGYSGIMEAPGEMVQGALYEVTEQALIALDNLEASTRTGIRDTVSWCWAKTANFTRPTYTG